LIRSPAVPIPSPTMMSNTEAIGQVLYTRYVYFFQAAGLILLVAMIGAIVLTLRERVGIKRQDISKQNARTQATAVELRKVPFRQGV
jgi:NADH-quinone oxidoreductase subunit J